MQKGFFQTIYVLCSPHSQLAWAFFKWKHFVVKWLCQPHFLQFIWCASACRRGDENFSIITFFIHANLVILKSCLGSTEGCVTDNNFCASQSENQIFHFNFSGWKDLTEIIIFLINFKFNFPNSGFPTPSATNILVRCSDHPCRSD